MIRDRLETEFNYSNMGIVATAIGVLDILSLTTAFRADRDNAPAFGLSAEPHFGVVNNLSVFHFGDNPVYWLVDNCLSRCTTRDSHHCGIDTGRDTVR